MFKLPLIYLCEACPGARYGDIARMLHHFWAQAFNRILAKPGLGQGLPIRSRDREGIGRRENAFIMTEELYSVGAELATLMP